MLTKERLQRIRTELNIDDDDILGDDKASILKAIDKAILKYRKWEKLNGMANLEKVISKLFVPGLPQELYDEAICIIVDLLDRNCDEDEFSYSWTNEVDKSYVLRLLQLYKETDHNKEIVECALGARLYNTKKVKLRRRKPGTPQPVREEHHFDRDLSDDEVDMEDDN